MSTNPHECNCEHAVDPEDPEDDWHFRRVCENCAYVWWSLHCPHDLIQNPCPKCGVSSCVDEVTGVVTHTWNVS